jgi:hypothetical protein
MQLSISLACAAAYLLAMALTGPIAWVLSGHTSGSIRSVDRALRCWSQFTWQRGCLSLWLCLLPYIVVFERN